MTKSRYQKALERNLFEASKSILERRVLIGIEKAGKYSISPFVNIVYEGLFNDMIAHAIKILEDRKSNASFWYIKRCKEKEINEFIQNKGFDIKKVENIVAPLKYIRDKTHFHIDRDSVKDSKEVWNSAGVKGKDLADVVDTVWEILKYLFKLEYSKDFDLLDYNGKDATLIAKYAEDLRRASSRRAGENGGFLED